MIAEKTKVIYFLAKDWTGQISLRLKKKIVFWRRRFSAHDEQ